MVLQKYFAVFISVFLLQEVESKDQQQTPKTLAGSTKQTESITATAGEIPDKTSELWKCIEFVKSCETVSEILCINLTKTKDEKLVFKNTLIGIH